MARTSQVAKLSKKLKFKNRQRNRCRSVRRAARFSAQIPNVPHLFSRLCVQGEIPGRAESELVTAMQTDPIADMLTRIRNAMRARHARVELPASKLKIEIARVLKEEGYISTYKLVDERRPGKHCACS